MNPNFQFPNPTSIPFHYQIRKKIKREKIEGSPKKMIDFEEFRRKIESNLTPLSSNFTPIKLNEKQPHKVFDKKIDLFEKGIIASSLIDIEEQETQKNNVLSDHSFEKRNYFLLYQNQPPKTKGNQVKNDVSEFDDQDEIEDDKKDESLYFDQIFFLSTQFGSEEILNYLLKNNPQLKNSLINYSSNWKDQYNRLQFPKDMLLEIISYFSIFTLCQFSLACRYFYEVARSTSVLNLKKSIINDTIFPLILKKYQKFLTLDIRDCSNLSLSSIYELLVNCNRLQTLKLTFDFSENCETYMYYLSFLKNLHSLHLDSNITGDALLSLASHLDKLNLRLLIISNGGKSCTTPSIDFALNQILLNFSSLEEFHLSLPLKPNAIPDIPNYSLKKLFLGWVEPNVLPRLQHFLSGFAAIHSIQLPKLSHENLTSFLRRFGSRLIDLDLGLSTKLNDDLCQKIAKFCPNLSSLYLPYTIGDLGIQNLLPCQKLSYIGASQLNKKISYLSLLFIVDNFPMIQSIELKSLRLSNLNPIVHSVKSTTNHKIQLIVK